MIIIIFYNNSIGDNMELKDSIKELDSGNTKVFGDLARKIEELKTVEYVLGIHQLINTIKEIHKKNKIKDLQANIFINDNGDGLYYFSVDVYKVKDSEKEMFSPAITSERKEIRKFNEKLNDALERLNPKASWVGEILEDSVTLELAEPECSNIESWFLNESVAPMYSAAILDLGLKDKPKENTKKMKL